MCDKYRGKYTGPQCVNVVQQQLVIPYSIGSTSFYSLPFPTSFLPPPLSTPQGSCYKFLCHSTHSNKVKQYLIKLSNTVHCEHLDKAAQDLLFNTCCWFRCTLQPWKGVLVKTPWLLWDTIITSPPMGSRDWPDDGGRKFLYTLATQQDSITTSSLFFLSYDKRQQHHVYGTCYTTLVLITKPNSPTFGRKCN
jgi:hypothetical protein